MHHARGIIRLLSGLTAGLLLCAGSTAADPESPGPQIVALPATPPSPRDNPASTAKIELGKQLFFDPRLSGDNNMSCASCHLPDKAFADGRALGQGHAGKPLARNSPSLLNVAFYDKYFWDGRAASLEDQALQPIQSPEEMNQPLDQLVRELNRVPGYTAQFQDVFGGKATRKRIAQALAAFQRTLVTEPSPFDRFLAGDRSALSAEARYGFELFTGEAGCVRCHHGPLLSDGRFYRLGVSHEDEGRAAVTGEPGDRGKFRTPGLRNVSQTAPYMHDGSLKTLAQVVEFYYRNAPTAAPGGKPLDVEPLLDRSYSEMGALVAFLESLTGRAPEIILPELPED